MPRSSPSLNAPPPISFRLDVESRQILAGRAASLGVSANELARHYVLNALRESEERSALREDVETLQREIAASRADLALAVAALLRCSGTIEDAEANAWVKANLNLPCSPSPRP